MPSPLFKLLILLGLAATVAVLLRWMGGSSLAVSLFYGSLFAACGIVVASFSAMQRRE
jgi:hypothetical protein